MIIETIFSTLDANGNPNFAPMGIEWGEAIRHSAPVPHQPDLSQFVVQRLWRGEFVRQRSGFCPVRSI